MTPTTFETIEHILLPILLAVLSGGLVAGFMQQRTAARVANIDGLKETIATMQTEMDHMQERMNVMRVELGANAVTISDLRAQISVLQTRNLDLVDQLTTMRRQFAKRQQQPVTP
jgi:septal ring factor EnvC (AmiA/AmiB activator)